MSPGTVTSPLAAISVALASGNGTASDYYSAEAGAVRSAAEAPYSNLATSIALAGAGVTSSAILNQVFQPRQGAPEIMDFNWSSGRGLISRTYGSGEAPASLHLPGREVVEFNGNGNETSRTYGVGTFALALQQNLRQLQVDTTATAKGFGESVLHPEWNLMFAGGLTLGGTVFGESAGAVRSALADAEVLGLRAIPTAEELRNTPGVVTLSRTLKAAKGNWLDPAVPTPIPSQVADKLVGQRFDAFGDLRAAIWRTIAAEEELNGAFSLSNLGNMKKGYAPFVPTEFQTDVSDAGMRFNLHHDPSIQSGGPVYDLGTLHITSPRVHDELHL